MWITALLCFALAVAATSAQLPQEDGEDCGNLGFQRKERRRGSDLPVCRRSEEQCCSAEYLEGVQDKVRDRLERFLRREFEDVVEEYQDEVDNLLVYFTRHFPRKLLQNLPLFEAIAENPAIRPLLARLIDNFEIDEDDDFNEREFLETLIEGLTRIGARLLRNDEDTAECIAGVLQSVVDREAVRNLRDYLRRIRRGITALMQMGRFLEGQRNRVIRGGRIIDRCVERFTEIAFCSRCTRRTPPMCFGTCNALVRGCYSPYYTAFNRRYRKFWDKVQEIVELLNKTVEDVGETELINFSDALREVREQCGVTLSDNNRSKRQGNRGNDNDKNRQTPRMRTTSRSKTNDTDDGSGEEETTTKGRSTGTTSRSKTKDTDDGSGEEETTTKGRSTGTTSRSKTKDTDDGSGEEETTTKGRSTGTTKSTGDSTSAAVLDIAGDVEFIPRALVEGIYQLDGAFEYGRRGRNLHFCADALQDDEDEDDEYCPHTGREARECGISDVCTSKCYCTDGRNNITKDNETDHTFYSSDVEDQGDNPVLDISVEELMEELQMIESTEDPVASFLTSDEFRTVDPSVEEERVEGGNGSAAGLGVSLCALLLTAMATLLP